MIRLNGDQIKTNIDEEELRVESAKAELVAALPHLDDERLLLCNGVKDRTMLSLILSAQQLGQSIIIDNRPGADGAIAGNIVVKAELRRRGVGAAEGEPAMKLVLRFAVVVVALWVAVRYVPGISGAWMPSPRSHASRSSWVRARVA